MQHRVRTQPVLFNGKYQLFFNAKNEVIAKIYIIGLSIICKCFVSGNDLKTS